MLQFFIIIFLHDHTYRLSSIPCFFVLLMLYFCHFDVDLAGEAKNLQAQFRHDLPKNWPIWAFKYTSGKKKIFLLCTSFQGCGSVSFCRIRFTLLCNFTNNIYWTKIRVVSFGQIQICFFFEGRIQIEVRRIRNPLFFTYHSW